MAKKSQKPAFPMASPTGKPSMPPIPSTPAGGGFSPMAPPMAKGPVAGSRKPNPFAKKKGK